MNDGLVIRETKFHKSRLVPLHESTAAALSRYLERRQRVPTEHDRIFVSLKRTPLCYMTVHNTFRRLCANIGLLGTPEGRRPRLHDLRHSVAVRALEACPQARDQVTPHVLAPQYVLRSRLMFISGCHHRGNVISMAVRISAESGR